MNTIYQSPKLSHVFSTLVNKALEDIDNLNKAAQSLNLGGFPFLKNSVSGTFKRNNLNSKGFYSALAFIRDNYKTLDLSITLSHQLHLTIFQEVTKDYELRGVFKTKENHIKHFFSNGNIYDNKCTTPPESCQFEVQKLFSWVTLQLQSSSLHPLILASLFKFQFVSIHPYPDGNGKISRLLTMLILLKSGYDVFQNISLEQIMEPVNDEYVKTLMCCQFYLPKRIAEIEYWFLFFLSLVKSAYILRSFLIQNQSSSLIIPPKNI